MTDLNQWVPLVLSLAVLLAAGAVLYTSIKVDRSTGSIERRLTRMDKLMGRFDGETNNRKER